MKLMLDTSRFRKVEVAKPFEPRVDQDGNQRRDKKGGTGLPLWACKVAVYTDEDVEVLLVTVAIDTPPPLIQEQHVTLSGLEAMPWSTSKGEPRVAFRAESLTPVSSTKSATPIKAAVS